MYSFFNATDDRKKLLLNLRQPEIDKSRKLNGEYGSFNELVLKAKQAKDYFLLIGPPGTGKTSFGLVSILKEALREAGANILLASFTNRAVDEICSKLTKENIAFIRIGSELSCDAAYHNYLLCNKTAECKDVNDIRKMIACTNVFVGTTSALTSKQNLFNIKHFDLAIIDESSQILEPQLLGLICAQQNNRNAIDKFVFIGDYKQLPAVVQQTKDESEVKEESLRNIGFTNCRKSLFERLISLQKENNDLTYLMKRQGRMHPDVAAFSNMTFYENKLQPVPVTHQLQTTLPYHRFNRNDVWENMIATKRMCFITSNSYQTTNIKVNTNEAEEIAAIIHAIWNIYKMNNKPFDSKQTVGVIVPYRNQISTIRKELSKYDINELLDITIDTVERYQGSERDIIIYGFTIHKLHQLDFLTSNTFADNNEIIDRKLNVALTRAREQMFIIGNPIILKMDLLFSKLMDYAKKIDSYIEVSVQKNKESDYYDT
jgi:superfamily I DNA and/or RNA helicase